MHKGTHSPAVESLGVWSPGVSPRPRSGALHRAGSGRFPRMSRKTTSRSMPRRRTWPWSVLLVQGRECFTGSPGGTGSHWTFIDWFMPATSSQGRYGFPDRMYWPTGAAWLPRIRAAVWKCLRSGRRQGDGGRAFWPPSQGQRPGSCGAPVTQEVSPRQDHRWEQGSAKRTCCRAAILPGAESRIWIVAKSSWSVARAGKQRIRRRSLEPGAGTVPQHQRYGTASLKLFGYAKVGQLLRRLERSRRLPEGRSKASNRLYDWPSSTRALR
jgi:hypothetical protein